MIAAVAAYPGFEEAGRRARIVDVSSGEYYGDGLPGHPDPRALDPAGARGPRLGAEGLARRRDPPDARLLPAEPPGRAMTRPSRRPQGRLRHVRGDARRHPAAARDLRGARDPRDVLLHAGARPLGRGGAADLHAQGLPREDDPLARPVALRLADDALRNPAAGADDRRALRGRRCAPRSRRGPRNGRPRLGPRRLARSASTA